MMIANKLDNMRWFSHRRSPSPPGGHTMASPVAACCVRPSYDSRPTMHCQWGWLSSFSFLSLVTLTFDLWPWHSNSSEIFVQCTQPTSLIVLRLIVRKLSCGQTNKQTNKVTNWQTNRRRWKHPPRLATLHRWAITR